MVVQNCHKILNELDQIEEAILHYKELLNIMDEDMDCDDVLRSCYLLHLEKKKDLNKTHSSVPSSLNVANS